MQTRAEMIKRLAQADTPSIRLFALTKLQGLPCDDPQVVRAQEQVANDEPVHSILKEQHPEGFWIWDHSHYTPKYKATHWSMKLLTEMGLSGSHPAMQQGAFYMRERLRPTIIKTLEQNEMGLACFWGTFLRYQLHCGQLTDTTIQMVIDQLVLEIQNDCTCPYNYGLPCAWGVIRAMWGLASIPSEKRSLQVQQAIRHGLEFILERYSLTKADYPYQDRIHKAWFSLNFPLFYHTDILFTLRIMQELDTLDHPAARQALDWLAGKQLKSGWWRGASPTRSRSWAFTSGQDTVDTWVTLHAMTLLD